MRNQQVVTTKAGPWFSEVVLVENLTKRWKSFDKSWKIWKKLKILKKVGKFEKSLKIWKKLENLRKVGKLEKSLKIW